MALFSILIPAKGRPLYARDAVLSAMRQDFDDFDVTFSNNGADPAVKAAVAEFMADSRFHYIEQPSILDMPLHWEVASRSATGDYFLVLTDRCVLKQGMLRKLSTLLRIEPDDIEIVTWGGETYDNASGMLLSLPADTATTRRLKTADVVLSFALGLILWEAMR